MSNFGFRHLRVVNPYEPAFREARSAVGAAALLASAAEFKSVAEAIADCTLVVGTTAVGDRELQHPVRRLEDGARLIRNRLGSGRVALLFGSERVGLSNKDLSHCHWLMRIPTREEHRSVNLGQAVAICLYELGRASKAARPLEKQTPASGSEIERIAVVLLDALRLSGYSKSRRAQRTEEKVHRLLRRLNLSAMDAKVLLGMLRQTVWKLRSGSDLPR
jgi:tRNA/rRNA methyltransferase